MGDEWRVEIMDDLPYRIVEEMGLGLTFRSCACGQLPCARLRPLRDAFEAIAATMRSQCLQKVRELRDGWLERESAHLDSHGTCPAAEDLSKQVSAANKIIAALESLPLDQVEQEKPQQQTTAAHRHDCGMPDCFICYGGKQ